MRQRGVACTVWSDTQREVSGMARMLKSRRGVAMIEYALLAALIALVVAVALTPLGTAIAGIFGRIRTCVTGGAC